MKKIISREESKSIMLSIMDAIDEICKENGLTYFITAGTLLGAVRHKGFIPWDDDIDIVLFREDYDKLLSILKSQDKYSWLGLVDPDNSNYFYPFAKAVDNRTIAKQEDNTSEYGIWVDVFPLNAFPNLQKEQKSFMRNCQKFRAMIISMTTDFVHAQFSKKFFIKSAIKILSLFVGKQAIKKWAIDYMEKYNGKGTDFVGSTFTPYKNEIIKKEKMLPTVELDFEGRKYSAPNCWHEYLTNIYHDYMQLPPVEKRRTHKVTAWWK